jgi:nucleotide-binding universal stress UspA family protein
MYEHILVPLDGSPLAEQVLPYVDALVAKFGSRVTLLRAISSRERMIAAETPFSFVDPTPIIDAEREEAEAYLAGWAKRLNSQGLSAQYKCPEGSPAEVIVELARQLAIDLIAMTTHGRTGLVRVLLGSVATAVVQNTPCPIRRDSTSTKRRVNSRKTSTVIARPMRAFLSVPESWIVTDYLPTFNSSVLLTDKRASGLRSRRALPEIAGADGGNGERPSRHDTVARSPYVPGSRNMLASVQSPMAESASHIK